MNRLSAIALLAFSAAVCAQTPAELDELYAAQAALRAAQAVLDAKKEIVVRHNAEAVAAVNTAMRPSEERFAAIETALAQAVSTLDAIKAREDATKAAAQAALTAASTATTILGLRAAVVPFLRQQATP